MKKQVHIFFAALMFLTRLPIPKWVKHDDVYLQKSSRYFTLVGLIVGLCSAIIYISAVSILPNTIAIILSMIGSILITGSFHEDGFADVCDAFGGGYTKEKILEIMKDSRLGTYGTVGLVLILLLKYLLLLELSTTAMATSFTIIPINYNFQFPIILVAAHSLSRLMPLVVIQIQEYVFQSDVSKSKPLASQKINFSEMSFAILITLIPFLFLPIQLYAAIVLMLIATILLGKYFKKHIGGYTGDCLGTVQQVSEQVFYLCVLIITKFLFF